MTTIFNTSFNDNLKRILGHRESSERANQNSPAPAKEFSQVLADLDTPERSANTSNGLVPADIPIERVKATVRSELFLTSEDPVFALTKNLTEIGECAGNECTLEELSGKISVKNPTLADGSTDWDEVPPPPDIKSMERISMRVPSTSIKSPLNYAKEDIFNIIDTAGKYHGIDPFLSRAVAQAESAFRPNAVSQDGHASKGIFQLLDSTAKDLIGRFNLKEEYDPFDPALNAHLGVGYLRRLHDIFSEETNLGGNLRTVPVKSAADLEKVALAAFNAGEGNVASAQRRARASGKDPAQFAAIEPYLPPSTRAYVNRVTEFRSQIARAEGDEEIV